MLSIGVSYDDFWHREADVVRCYVEAHEVHERNRLIAEDFNAWNAGRYVLTALSVVMSQAFSKHSNAEYPAEPLLASELDELLAKQKREREIEKAHRDFLALAALLEKQQGLGEPN